MASEWVAGDGRAPVAGGGSRVAVSDLAERTRTATRFDTEDLRELTRLLC